MASMITTSDNPFDYFNDFENWYNFDERIKGYGTCGLLARYAKTSSALSPADNEVLIDLACDQLLKDYANGVLGYENVYYIKVRQGVQTPEGGPD